MSSALGRNLCKYFNFFPRVLMKMDMGDKKNYSKAIHQHYIQPFPHAGTRKGTWIFPRSFLAEDRWLTQLWDKRNSLTGLPVLLLWRLKDKAFPKPCLSRWESAFAQCTSIKFEYSGHNSPEEIGREAITFVQDFLKKYRIHD